MFVIQTVIYEKNATQTPQTSMQHTSLFLEQGYRTFGILRKNRTCKGQLTAHKKYSQAVAPTGTERIINSNWASSSPILPMEIRRSVRISFEIDFNRLLTVNQSRNTF